MKTKNIKHIKTNMILFIFSILISMVLADITKIPELEWSKIDIYSAEGIELPEARKDYAIGYYPDQTTMIIFGGRSKSGKILGDTWLFNFSNKMWKKPTMVLNGQAIHPEPRYGMVFGNDQPPSNSFRSTFVIATGKGEGDNIYNDVWSFDFINECWTKIPSTGTIPSPRYDAIGGIDFTRLPELNQISKEYLILSHGRNDNEFFSDTYLLKLDGRSQQGDYSQLTAEWIKLNTLKTPEPREAATGAVVSGDRLVMFGGCEVKTQNCTSSVYYLDVNFLNFRETVEDNPEWHEVSNDCVRPKNYASSVRGTDQSITNIIENDLVFFFGGEPDIKYGQDSIGEVSIFDVAKEKIFGVIPKAVDNKYPTAKKGSRLLGTLSDISGESFNIILYGGEPINSEEDWSTEIWSLKVSNVDFTYYPKTPETMEMTKCYELLKPDEIEQIRKEIDNKKEESTLNFIVFALAFLLAIPVTVIASRSMNCFTKRWSYVFCGLCLISIIFSFISLLTRINNKDAIFIMECIILAMLFIYIFSSLLRPKQPNINFNKGQVNAAGVPINIDDSVVKRDDKIIPSPTATHYNKENKKNKNERQTSSSNLLIEPNKNNVNINNENQKINKRNKRISNKKSMETSSSINDSTVNKTNKKRLAVVDSNSNLAENENDSVSSEKDSPFLSPVFINPNIKEYEDEENESEESYISDIEEDEEEILKNKYLLMAKIWLTSQRILGLIILIMTIVIIYLSLKNKKSKLYQKTAIFIIWIAVVIIAYIISVIVAWKMHSSMALIKAKRMSFRSGEPLEPNHGNSWSVPVDQMKRFSLISEGSYGKTSAYEDMCTLSNYSQTVNINNVSSQNPNYSIPPLPVTPNFLNTHGIFTTQQSYTNYQTPSPPSSLINQQNKYSQEVAASSSGMNRPGSYKETDVNNYENKLSCGSSVHSYNSKDETKRGRSSSMGDNKHYQPSEALSNTCNTNTNKALNISTQSQSSQVQLIQPLSTATTATSHLSKMDSYGSIGHINPSSIPSPVMGMEININTTPTSSLCESENEIDLPQRNNTIDNMNDKEVMVVMTVPKRKLAVVNL